jgi:hypothetical protein
MIDPSEPSEKPDNPGPTSEKAALPAREAEPGAGSGESSKPDPAAESSSAAGAGQAAPGNERAPGELATSDVTESPAQGEMVPAVLSHDQIELIRRRRKDKTIGLVIVSVTFIISMIGSLYAKKLSEPELSEPPGPPTTLGVDNWPRRVDALQALEVARTVTRRDLLRGFVAEQVKSDGTLDFSKVGRRVRYSFQSEPGEGPQPPRKPDMLPRRTYCGKQNVHIKKLGVVADPDMASYPCATKQKEALPDPRCTLKQVWDHALTKGAPRKKLARIEYYPSEAGPAYRFNVPGTKFRFSLNGDCTRELNSQEAVGGVP